MGYTTTKTRSVACTAILACALAAGAAEIRVRGIVQDASNGKALSGASASLSANGMSTKTSSTGYFLLQKSTSVTSRESYGAKLIGTQLSILVPDGKTASLSIRASDPSGRNIPVFTGFSAPGRKTIDLSQALPAPGVYLLAVSIEGVRSATFRLVSDGHSMRLASDATDSDAASRATAAAWDTLVVSNSGYTTAKVALSSSTDSVLVKLQPVAPPIGNDVANGYATVNGTCTGGGSATPTTVTTLAELKTAASDKNPRVIIVSGTINAVNTVPIASNKTIIGKDKDAKIYGGIEMNGVSNVIVRNLSIQGVYPNSGAGDAVAVKGGSHHIWLDHLAIWDAPDGNLDITQASTYVTVSWCKFWYTDANHPHRLNGLIGAGGGTQPGDWGKNKVTYHHNWFADLVDQRMPRAMYGEVHVYSNYYTAKGNGYCVGFGSYASVLVENNYFKGVSNPISFMYDLYAWVVQRGNTYDGTTGTGPKLEGKQGSRYETNPDQPFEVKALSTVPYQYTATPAAEVPTLVSKNAGPQ